MAFDWTPEIEQNQINYWTFDAEPDLLLDLYPNAGVAYSFRKLRKAQNLALRVRRESDSQVLDVGFNGVHLDTASIASFCAGTTGKMVIWYDQSGSGRDQSQADPLKQVTIFEAGAMVTDSNGNLAAYNYNNAWMSGAGSFLAGTTNRCCFSVNETDATDTVYSILDGIAPSGNAGTRWGIQLKRILGVSYPEAAAIFPAGGSIGWNIREQVPKLITYLKSGTQLNSVDYFENGTQQAVSGSQNTSTIINTDAGALSLWSNLGNQEASVANSLWLTEYIHYPESLVVDRVPIEAEIMSYWSVTP